MEGAGTSGARALVAAAMLAVLGLPACGNSSAAPALPSDAGATDVVATDARTGGSIKHVFVVAMENADATSVYDGADWQYVRGELLAQAARALAFQDELGIRLPSEP